jgi:hypothetical protein
MSHVADLAPNDPELTEYDMRHCVIYVRTLDADQNSSLPVRK